MQKITIQEIMTTELITVRFDETVTKVAEVFKNNSFHHIPIVNADDYYGIEALQKVADFLINDCNEKHYSMVGFHLKNTISENGSVSRGVCSTDKNDCLSTVTERTSIRRIDKTICYEENGEKIFLKDDTIVSMNLWGFHNNIFEHTRKMFVDFVKNNPEDPKAEFYIPRVANDLLEKKAIELKVLTSTEKWYGVTYKEDKDDVVTAMKNLHSSGKYPKALWNIEID